MKILELKIKNLENKIVREISFKKVGVSYVYGDIQDPKNLGATINSLGKTLLLKFIDYIFGANEDSSIVKEAIYNYKLEAIIEHNNNNYLICRILGNSESIYINGEPYTLADYKEYLGIKRSLYSKQIILKKKSTEISFRTNPSKEDVISCLELLQLNDILDSIDKIYKSQDKIKELKTSKKELISFYGNFDVKQINEEIYFIDKEVDRLTLNLLEISKKIKSIQISEIQKDIVLEYANKSKELKGLKSQFERKRLEYERLIQFITNSNKVDISSEHILAIFEKAKQEVPEMVQKSLYEVEEFHKKVYEERKEFLNQKKAKLQGEMDDVKEKINVLSIEIDKIGLIISMNEVYQESIDLYEKYNTDLQELKYKQGKLSQVKEIDNSIEMENNSLINSFEEASSTRKKYDELVIAYRDFIFNITKKIYDNDVNSYFDIKVRPKHLINRPITFEFTLKGDTGEGVNEVKKNLVDFLICKYNNYSEIMIQDSSCFNGIDPRQITGMLSQLTEIANESNKQIIIAINKYQLGNYEEAIRMVEQDSAIILSEHDKLLSFDF
ncbi:DUF2326 domain-containing protein [Paenibacillus kyungheensis]